jgi:nitroimidazol reductase NimA-like FMN-containing flavoprotein (pyridoxamine 5'-phosphate oxidase superfamily)
MLGKLTNRQIDHVLQSQYIGRIGCCVDNQAYVVPITYAYDGACIYATSKEGMKIDIMRKNPRVCLEVDIIENMANWRSLIILGKFQELVDERERKKAITILMDKVMPLITSETVKPKNQTQAPQIVEKEKRPVFYRIVIAQKTGRYEKTQG